MEDLNIQLDNLTIDDEKEFKEIIIDSCKRLLNERKEIIINISKKLDLEIKNRMTKREIFNLILPQLKTLKNNEIIDILKESNISSNKIKIEVKNLLSKNININTLIESGCCLTLQDFFEQNIILKKKFLNTCNLINVNNKIVGSDIKCKKIQGLYILSIKKKDDNKDYIIKLGSFAESQGMKKRLESFGGGNYDTGSSTNKWFQNFLKKVIEENYTVKMTYYEYEMNKIEITGLNDKTKEVTPYVIREVETELFNMYLSSNSQIAPIFGSNCL
jgi:hypothetical protein